MESISLFFPQDNLLEKRPQNETQVMWYIFLDWMYS